MFKRHCVIIKPKNYFRHIATSKQVFSYMC